METKGKCKIRVFHIKQFILIKQGFVFRIIAIREANINPAVCDNQKFAKIQYLSIYTHLYSVYVIALPSAKLQVITVSWFLSPSTATTVIRSLPGGLNCGKKLEIHYPSYQKMFSGPRRLQYVADDAVAKLYLT